MTSTFSFHHPWALWLAALCVPYAVIRFLIRDRRAVGFPPLQFHPPTTIWRGAFFAPLFLEMVVLALLAVAAAGPQTVNTREFVSETGADIALCLDISLSMQAADIRPNRLEALKKLCSELIANEESDRVAIYAFAGEVFTQSPLTSDHDVILEQIDGLSFESIDHAKSGGSAIGDAILVASDGLTQQHIKGRGQAILLVTDGEFYGGIDPHIAAKLARDSGIHLYVVGIGGDNEVPVYVNNKPLLDTAGKTFTTKADDTLLKEIARTAQGRYWRAGNANLLTQVFDEVSRLEKTPLKVDRVSLSRSYRPQLAIVLLFVFGAWLCLEGMVLRRPFR